MLTPKLRDPETTRPEGRRQVITVRLPETLRDGRGAVMTMDAASLDDIIGNLDLAAERDELYNFAVNGELIVHGEHAVTLADGDEVEIVVAFSGG